MEKVGLVLAGGAARGAYEAGALSVLLPKLEELGQRPTVIVGTSAGALHAAYLAARADRPANEVMAEAIELWESLEFEDVVAPVGQMRTFRKLVRYVRGVTGLGQADVFKLLDPAPMRKTLGPVLPFPIPPAAMDELDAAAVVATSAATSRSVVFFQGKPDLEPASDDKRGIDYVPIELTLEHVMASAAIPIMFPAVTLPEKPPHAPVSGKNWYFDGGTRLNAPIKPALELGAERVVVIALNSVQQQRQPTQRPNPDEQPDVADGLLQLLQAALVDPLVQDMEDLKKKNELKRAELEKKQKPEQPLPYKEVPYIFIGPKSPYEVGEIASEAYADYADGHLDPIAMLGRVAGTRGGPVHGEATSYVFFAAPFTRRLVQRGADEAKKWLKSHSPDNPWET